MAWNLAGMYLQCKKEKNKIPPASLRALSETTHLRKGDRDAKSSEENRQKGEMLQKVVSAQKFQAKGLDAGGNFTNYA